MYVNGQSTCVFGATKFYLMWKMSTEAGISDSHIDEHLNTKKHEYLGAYRPETLKYIIITPISGNFLSNILVQH